MIEAASRMRTAVPVMAGVTIERRFAPPRASVSRVKFEDLVNGEHGRLAVLADAFGAAPLDGPV